MRLEGGVFDPGGVDNLGGEAPKVPESDVKSEIVQVDDERFAVRRVQDVEPVLEHARELHNSGDHGSSEMRLAAEFPAVLVEKYCHDHGITFAQFMEDQSHVRTMLNDPSLAYFRIWKGRV